MKNAVSPKMGFVFVLLVILLLVGLPVAVWLDLRNLADSNLRRQASDLNSIITSVRGYYASNVVGRILAAPPGTATRVVHNYEIFPARFPSPRHFHWNSAKSSVNNSTTLSIALSPTTHSPTELRISLICSRLMRFAVCGKTRIR